MPARLPVVVRGQDTLDTVSRAYEAMAEHWKLPNALLTGTRGMRKAGETWLAKEPAESDASYDLRLSRSFLLNAYRDALRNLSERPFTVPPQPGSAFPEALWEMAEDIDLSGRSLTQFARELLWMGIHYGQAHILIDFPEIGSGAGPLTLAEEQAAGARPYFVLVNPETVIGWNSERIAGVETLTELRILETTLERTEDGFTEEEVQRLRLYTLNVSGQQEPVGDMGAEPPGAWFRVFRRVAGSSGNTNTAWELEREGPITLGRIPLRTFYTCREGFMTALPALEDMAWLNLAHWTSSSDQRNLLSYARAGILHASGFGDDEVGAENEIGRRVWVSRDPAAKLSWVEHSGAAIDAGRQDLLDLETQMSALSLRPLVDRPGGQTATEKSIDTAQSHASLRSWVTSEGETLEAAFQDAADWLGMGEVNTALSVNTDFGITLRGEEATELRSLWMAGGLSRESLWSEYTRRGLLRSDFDPDQEAEALESELAGASGGGSAIDPTEPQ